MIWLLCLPPVLIWIALTVYVINEARQAPDGDETLFVGFARSGSTDDGSSLRR